MVRKRAWTFFSIVPLAVSIFVLAARIMGNASLIEINAIYFPIAMNTALCFFLVGITLLLFNYPLEQVQFTQILFGLLIVFISGLNIAQAIFGIDFNLNQLLLTLGSNDFQIKQMPINTGLAFIFIGLVFILMPIAQKKFFAGLIEFFIFIVFLISALSLCGYALNIGFLYNWFSDDNMLPISGFCFFCISLALAGIWKTIPASSELYYGREDARILILSGAILLCMAIAITLINFATFEEQYIVGKVSRIAPVIILTVLIGLLLLRLQVIPLVRRVIEAERGLITINKRLEESENRYALAVRGSNTGLWDWDIEKNKVYYSPYFKGMLGYADTDFGNTIEALKKALHPEDYDRVFAAVEEHLNNQTQYDIEYRLKRKTGEYHWFQAKGQAIWNEFGLPIRMAGSLIDITERKKSDKRLAAQYAVTKILSETSNFEDDAVRIIEALCEKLDWEVGSMWMVERGANMISCISIWSEPFPNLKNFSEVICKMRLPLGIGLPGKVWKSGQQLWIYDVTEDKHFTLSKEATEAGLHTALVFPIRIQKKVLGVLEFFSQQRQSADENILKTMSVITTQIGQFIQKRDAENHLHEIESHKAAILESASDSIITITSEGFIVSFNHRTLDIFGYQADELKNNNINILMPNFLNRLTYLPGRTTPVIYAVRKNKTQVPVEITTSKMYLNKQNVYVCVIRDVTERQQIEKMKDEFVTIVSHELRTPLTSIQGALSLLQGGAVGNFSEKVSKLLDIAKNNCERLLLLINDILDVEKIEAGKMDFHMEEVRLQDVIKESMEYTKLNAEKYNIKLKLNSIGEDFKVFADPNRLSQVLINLISNAIKFSAAGDVIEIQVQRRRNKIRTSVIDHGSGIPENFRSKVFQRFSQADTSSARNKGGTGLGLSISKSIIDKFNGHIDFVSKPYEETIFYFDLPEYSAPKAEIHKKTFLICENNISDANAIDKLLGSPNDKFEIVSNTKDAKQILSKNKYDYILVDIAFPESGRFLKYLFEEYSEKNLILVMNLISTSNFGLEGNILPVLSWLDSPIDFNNLLKILDRIKTKIKTLPRILYIQNDSDEEDAVYSLLQEYAHIIEVDLDNNKVKNYLETEDFDLVIIHLKEITEDVSDIFSIIVTRRLPILIISESEQDNLYAKYISNALTKTAISSELLSEKLTLFIKDSNPL